MTVGEALTSMSEARTTLEKRRAELLAELAQVNDALGINDAPIRALAWNQNDLQGQQAQAQLGHVGATYK